MVAIFKKYKPAWEKIRVVMSDKDMTVLAASFPDANLLISFFFWTEEYVFGAPPTTSLCH